MVTALDTHRMLYRNAVLRAYDAANPTTRVNFFNGDVDIGDEVYTNENGYLFYESGGRQPIECLNVVSDTIIKVSVDGGHNFDITWQVEDKAAGFVDETDIHNMTYRGSDGTRKTWQVLQADCDLPDYLLKSEYQTGIWGEQEMAVDGGIIAPEIWTHVITILSTAPASLVVDAVRLRAGQVITIRSRRDCTLDVRTGTGPSETLAVSNGHTYLLINTYATENTTAGLALIDITNNPITTADITNLAKTAVPVRAQKSVLLEQQATNEVIAVSSIGALHNSPFYIYLESNGNYGDCTVELPQADFVGELQIVLDMNASVLQISDSKVTLTVGTSSVVIVKPSLGQLLAFVKLVCWQNQNSVRYHKLIVEA